jgi:hypothetical protein
MLSFTWRVSAANSSATNVLPPKAWRATMKAIILVDALIICLAYVLYAAGSHGYLPSPILDLADPFL